MDLKKRAYRLFQSRYYQDLLRRYLRSLLGNYPADLHFLWAENNGKPPAWTDGKAIHVNLLSSDLFYTSTLEDMNAVNHGLIAHEATHILRSDMSQLDVLRTAVDTGNIPFSDLEIFRTEAYRERKTELADYLTGDRKDVKLVIGKFLKQVLNDMEDRYIDYACIARKDVGGKGLVILNMYMFDKSPTLTKMLRSGYNDLTILCNCIFQYAIAGILNNPGQIENTVTEMMKDISGIMDAAMVSVRTSDRLQAAFDILLISWPVLKAFIDSRAEEDEEQPMDNFLPIGLILPPDYDIEVDGDVEKLRQLYLLVPDPEAEDISEAMDLLRILVIGEGECEETAGEGLIEHVFESGDNLTEMEASITRDERIHEEELQLIRNLVDHGNRLVVDGMDMHKKCNYKIYRELTVSDQSIRKCQQLRKDYEKEIRKLVAAIREIVKKKPQSSNFNDYSGRRLQGNTLYRKDKKFFRKIQPKKKPDRIAVMLLIDESGSMSGSSLKNAVAMALIMYDVCRQLDISVAVYGHSTGNESNVDIYSHAEFDSKDGMDGCRIAGAREHGCNRDGGAIRYCCELLLKRPEDKKYFILLSDGCPNAEKYLGRKAEEDLTYLAEKYGAKMAFRAVGIGNEDVRKRNAKIYGRHFLDVPTVEDLPRTVGEDLKRYLIQNMTTVQ